MACIVGLVSLISSCTTLADIAENVFGPQGVSDRRKGESSGTPITMGDSTPERPSDAPDDDQRSEEFISAEQEILAIVNYHRDQNSLPPLIGSEELSEVARSHSADMGLRDFYSHVDPDGVTPNERISAALADRYYLLGTSENIAYSEASDGFVDTSSSALSRQFMDGWMNSPGHRANILRPDSTHIGIGLSRAGNRIYATQKFMRYLARLDHVSDGASLPPNEPVIQFTVNPALQIKDALVIRIDLPDPEARWPLPDNRYRVGYGFVEPEWVDENRFVVRLPVETYGPGTYAIRLGEDGGNRTYGQAFRFVV